jgi:hypothetical protein
MRRLVAFTVLALSLAVPAVGLAVTDGVDDGTLSVRNGTGKVVLQFSGSAVGRVGHGKIVITDPLDGDGAGFDLWGCDERFDKTDTTTVCTGSGIRFRAIGGRYKIAILRATGVFLSAVGHGSVLLDGRGEDPNVDGDGVYSLNDNPYRSLPNFPKSLDLAAPTGG